MKRVLFVDSDESVIQELRKIVHPERHNWDTTFITKPVEALERVQAGEPFDLVASGLRLAGMDGIQLLGAVKEHLPAAVRMLITQPVDGPALAKASNVAHQFLSRPLEPHTLRVLIGRALSIRDHLKDSPLRRRLHEMGGLPSLPVVYQEVLREISSPDSSVSGIGKVIEKDAGLSAKLLQVVNSAAVGLRHEVTSVVHAASLLGLEKLKGIVLMAEVFSRVQLEAMPAGFSLEALWRHSLKVGEYAKHIAAYEAYGTGTVDESFTAGLLHDIGLIVLATSLPAELTVAFALANEKKMSLFQAEHEVFGATHAHVGGYLLELWGLPDPIAEAIAYHDYPGGLPEENYPSSVPESCFTALTAVHVANYFCEDEVRVTDGQAPAAIDTVFLERLGFLDRLDAWWNACHRNP